MNNIYRLSELQRMGIKILGKNIKISKYVRIYNPQNLILHNNIRIDDYTILSGIGQIEIKNYVHIGPQSFITSGSKILLSDFTGLSSGVKLFGSSDNYNGNFMTNPTVPKKFVGTIIGDIILKPHVVIGAGSVVLPNITLGQGSAIGSLSLVNKNTEEWKIYAGSPIKFVKDRKKNCQLLENILIKENNLINK